jgi:hypothetical protein
MSCSYFFARKARTFVLVKQVKQEQRLTELPAERLQGVKQVKQAQYQ